ncbi:hypothetical protein PV783_33945 [Chitinophaga sp. CC14]|uniref:hypothetical protein n=1 Tax=Chitinophaga sp. CC14 TaxID=3029199 RepID=UPI003B80A375
MKLYKVADNAAQMFYDEFVTLEKYWPEVPEYKRTYDLLTYIEGKEYPGFECIEGGVFFNQNVEAIYLHIGKNPFTHSQIFALREQYLTQVGTVPDYYPPVDEAETIINGKPGYNVVRLVVEINKDGLNAYVKKQ